MSSFEVNLGHVWEGFFEVRRCWVLVWSEKLNKLKYFFCFCFFLYLFGFFFLREKRICERATYYCAWGGKWEGEGGKSGTRVPVSVLLKATTHPRAISGDDCGGWGVVSPQVFTLHVYENWEKQKCFLVSLSPLQGLISPILKCRCHSQPYSLFTPHPPTISFTPLVLPTPYKLTTQIHVSHDCSLPANRAKPTKHFKGTWRPTGPDLGSSPCPPPLSIWLTVTPSARHRAGNLLSLITLSIWSSPANSIFLSISSIHSYPHNHYPNPWLCHFSLSYC